MSCSLIPVEHGENDADDFFRLNKKIIVRVYYGGGSLKAPELPFCSCCDDAVKQEKYMRFNVTTDNYANGPHILRVTDSKGRAAVRKALFHNAVFGVNTAEGALSASLAAKQPWTVIVERSDYKPVRTYRGNPSKIHVKWDGKDSGGKVRVLWGEARWTHPPDDRYSFRLRIAGEQDRIYTVNSISVSK